MILLKIATQINVHSHSMKAPGTQARTIY